MRPWVTLLAGPVVWFAHFMVVYLALEAGCTAGTGDSGLLVGVSGLALLTLAATVAAVAATAGAGVVAYRRWRSADHGSSQEHLALTSFLLAAMFAAAIVLVGLPALWVEPC